MTGNVFEDFKKLKKNVCIVLYHRRILKIVGNGGWNDWKC
ncbi:hypothetical protein CBFG_01846 [Clostridiales bacterium 1_7_47FAA]|nr:hypothetical protein CBFG_01846 [Clostridiales bacterium 1_7_47FAA]